MHEDKDTVRVMTLTAHTALNFRGTGVEWNPEQNKARHQREEYAEQACARSDWTEGLIASRRYWVEAQGRLHQ